MNKEEPNPASAKEQAEGSRENVNLGANPGHDSDREFEPEDDDLEGKTDSGPEPDVFGREIPPQKGR
jgi:hypothetical protein